MGFDAFQLDGRVALVTGASRGLGEAMADALAQAGASIAVVSRNLDECQQVADRLKSKTGREILAVQTDVTRRDEVEEMVCQTVAKFGKIDILVNNAGINVRKHLIDVADEDWESVMGVNLKGPMLCSRAVARVMIEEGCGSIINISSMMAFVSLSGRAAYSTSKAGLLGMTRTLALEWAPYSIRVNALCPGPFATPMNKVLLQDKELHTYFVSRIPLGRFGEPQELGGAIVFLASDASSFMTGASLVLDGGWTAQ
jgi:NAD(P)-dependent dehydrogenase (short-subunit alcohol dehydrogenase family)